MNNWGAVKLFNRFQSRYSLDESEIINPNG